MYSYCNELWSVLYVLAGSEFSRSERGGNNQWLTEKWCACAWNDFVISQQNYIIIIFYFTPLIQKSNQLLCVLNVKLKRVWFFWSITNEVEEAVQKSSPQVPSADFGFSTHNQQQQHRKRCKIPVLCLIAADCLRHTESGVNPTVARRQKQTLLPQ